MGPELLADLSRFSTPTLFNGLKQLGLPVEQLESADRRLIGCIAPALGTRVGIAVTRRVSTRTSGLAPSADQWCAHDKEMYRLVADTAMPCFLAFENIGAAEGRMCVWGEVTATINRAAGCVAGITNGPVRDLVEMEAADFATFAAGAATGGGFVDPVDVGRPITIAGLPIHSGDLLAGDRHGVIKIPLDLAPRLPQAICEVEARERRLLATAGIHKAVRM